MDTYSLKSLFNLRYEITERLKKYEYQKRRALNESEFSEFNKLVKEGQKDYSRMLASLDKEIANRIYKR